MKILPVAMVLFLAASFAFAVMYQISPARPPASALTFPICISEWGNVSQAMVASCDTFMAGYAPQLSPVYQTTVWFHQSYIEIAEGLVVLTALLPLLASGWLDFAWLHKPLAPRFPKRLLTGLVFAGASVFAILAVTDAVIPEFPKSAGAIISLVNAFYWRLYLPSVVDSLGVVAFAAFCLTLLLLALRRGFVGSSKTFGFPAVLFLTSMLLLFDSKDMSIQVADFAAWTLWGIPLVSNWFVFVMALFLTLFFSVPPLFKRYLARNPD